MENKKPANDNILSALVTEVALIKEQVRENSKIVKEMREILGSFRVLALVAKWITIVGAAVAVMYSSLHGAIAFLFIKK